jgi:hypothetical protein
LLLGQGCRVDVGVNDDDGAGNGLDEETKRTDREAALECCWMGRMLEAVGQVIEACLSDETIKPEYIPILSSIQLNPFPSPP